MDLHSTKRCFSRRAHRFPSLILALALLVVCVLPCVCVQTYADVQANISRLTDWQQKYLRVIRSLAAKDAYDTGVLASITAGQALYEGGWAQYRISVIANNQFGIKAYANWTGKVFDNNTYMLYDSYADLVRIKGASYARTASVWRAYESWDASVADHSKLFYDETKYAKVLAAKDYKTAAQEIVNAGYCTSESYAPTLIRIIEQYGLDTLDTEKPTSDGVVGLIMDCSRLTVGIGEDASLQASAYPETEISGIVWESSDPDIATVDENGVIQAKAQGVTLITATYSGKEAACIVCVGTNATVMDSDTGVYASPDPNATKLGMVRRGMPICITSERVYTAPDGTNYYPVRGNASAGGIVTGYAPVKLVYSTLQTVSVLHTKKELNLEPNTTYAVSIEIAPADAVDKTLQWSSSDPSVVSVDAMGVLTAKNRGNAYVTATAANGMSARILVHVGDKVEYQAVTTSNLYVRNAPNESATRLGLIAEGTKIQLLSEPQNGWYLVRAEVVSGDIVTGYSSATYIELLEDGVTLPPYVPTDPTDPTVSLRYGTVSVDEGSYLNVRASAGTNGAKVMSLENGASVTIVGDDIYVESERVYKVWYKLQISVDGMLYEGYAASAFIRIKETEPSIPPTPPTPPDPPVMQYTVTEDRVLGVALQTTLAAFRNILGETVTVYKPDGTPLKDSDLVATGYTVRSAIGNEPAAVRVIIVKGDLNGDGKASMPDYLLLKRGVLGSVNVTGYMLEAALLTGRNRITASDYFLLKRVVLGTAKL